jgi:hypothetical protein
MDAGRTAQIPKNRSMGWVKRTRPRPFSAADLSTSMAGA